MNANKKSTISILPDKFSFYEFVVINKIGSIIFYIPYDICNRHCRPQPYKYMDAIGHAIYNDWFLIFAFDDSGDVLVQMGFPFRCNQVFSALYRKYYLDYNWENVPDMKSI